jgi:hypothetical protein
VSRVRELTRGIIAVMYSSSNKRCLWIDEAPGRREAEVRSDSFMVTRTTTGSGYADLNNRSAQTISIASWMTTQSNGR